MIWCVSQVYALGAVQNMCTDLAYVERMQQTGVVSPRPRYTCPHRAHLYLHLHLNDTRLLLLRTSEAVVPRPCGVPTQMWGCPDPHPYPHPHNR